MWGRTPAAAILLLLAPQRAQAAGLDGAAMNWPFALPFAGLLLTIALGPLLFPKLWHAHYGKIAAAWSMAALALIGWFAGGAVTAAALVHAMLGEHLSFIVLLFALYTVAGGIVVGGDIKGTPASNVAILLIGSAMASVVGTTGAAMILVRPLIRANIARPHNTRVLIFFIILGAKVGGSLSRIGPTDALELPHGLTACMLTQNFIAAALAKHCLTMPARYHRSIFG